MNTNLNNEEYPRLTPPEVVYEGKAALKKAPVVPVWTRVAAAAAAVALLVGLFWHRSAVPNLPMIAELTPKTGFLMAPPSEARGRQSKVIYPVNPVNTANTVNPVESVEPAESLETMRLPQLAELSSKPALFLPTQDVPANIITRDEVYYASSNELLEDDDTLSFARRTIYAMSDGEYNSLFEMFTKGFRDFKVELASAATTLQSSRYLISQRGR